MACRHVLAEILALAFGQLSQPAAATLRQTESEDFFHLYDIVIRGSGVKWCTERRCRGPMYHTWTPSVFGLGVTR